MVVVVVVVVVCLFLLLFFVGFGLLLLCHRHVDSTGASVLLQSIIIQRQAHKTAAFCINETILVR